MSSQDPLRRMARVVALALLLALAAPAAHAGHHTAANIALGLV